MISLLFVEDDSNKIDAVRRIVDEILGDLCVLTVANTVTEAYGHLQGTTFDLLLLDLNIPRRPGEKPDKGGGVSLLEKVRVDPRLRKPGSIIGLTAFEQLRAEFKETFERDLWFLIQYERASVDWEDQLARRLVYLAQSEAWAAKAYQTDLAIITALETPELEQVLRHEGSWRRHGVEGDPGIYHECSVKGASKEITVIASAVGDMGMAMCSAHAMKIIYTFRPRYLAMVGITAGVSGNPGDIIVADQMWDYGSGKQGVTLEGEAVRSPAPVPILIDAGLKAKLNCFARQSTTTLSAIEASWKGEVGGARLGMKMGPLASGAAVVADRRIMDQVQSQNRKLLGVEMEAYGVMCAARMCAEPRPRVIVIKSVCDFGDAKKDDRFQRYAAYTSSEYLFAFVRDQLP